MRKPGFIIDVPMNLSVAVRGVTKKQAMQIARAYADSLQPSEHEVAGYCSIEKVDITEVSLCSPSDESCEVLDELESDDDGDEL